MKSVRRPPVGASLSQEVGEWRGEAAGEAGKRYSCGASVGPLAAGRGSRGGYVAITSPTNPERPLSTSPETPDTSSRAPPRVAIAGR